MAERNNDDKEAKLRKAIADFLQSMGYECPETDHNTHKAWAECRLINRKLITLEDSSSLNSRLMQDPSRITPAKIPPEVKRFIHNVLGSDQTVELVYQNHLSIADVNSCRLMMPSRHVHRLDILQQMKGASSIRLYVLSRLRHYDVELTQWDDFGRKNYVLMGDWSKVVIENELEKNTVVQLWSFRLGDIRCLLLVPVDGGSNHGDTGGGDDGKSPEGGETNGVEGSKSRKGKEKVYEF